MWSSFPSFVSVLSIRAENFKMWCNTKYNRICWTFLIIGKFLCIIDTFWSLFDEFVVSIRNPASRFSYKTSISLQSFKFPAQMVDGVAGYVIKHSSNNILINDSQKPLSTYQTTGHDRRNISLIYSFSHSLSFHLSLSLLCLSGTGQKLFSNKWDATHLVLDNDA